MTGSLWLGARPMSRRFCCLSLAVPRRCGLGVRKLTYPAKFIAMLTTVVSVVNCIYVQRFSTYGDDTGQLAGSSQQARQSLGAGKRPEN